MRKRISFLIGLGLLLGASLYLKLALVDHSYAAPDEAQLSAAIAARLTGDGFTVGTRPMLGRDAVIARRGKCDILAVRLDGRGHGLDRFKIEARTIGTTEFSYKGESFAEFPQFRPLIEEQVWRFLQPLDGERAFAPLIGIARNASCRLPQDYFGGFEVGPEGL